MIYANGSTPGQWKAHGRYLARETATHEQDTRGAGFDGNGDGVDVESTLNGWQRAGDARLWKIIISPEFGDRMDLRRHTRELMERIERELGPLEWVAVAHYNTEHPHVHVALRGVSDSQELRLAKDYIKHRIREHAEDLATAQLGYRTREDALEAQQREVTQRRFTSLDRRLLSAAMPAESRPDTLHIRPRDGSPEAARLAVLHRMGLAHRAGWGDWELGANLKTVLQAVQRAADRQKILAAHGTVVSDQRLPLQVLDTARLGSVEGRVLVHGEEEHSGRSYLMLEGTDARIHYVQYTPEITGARARGLLRPNNFVRLRRGLIEDVEVQDLGDSEALLTNRRHFESQAQGLLKRGVVPTDEGWGGWLGRYHKELAAASDQLRQPERSRHRGLDR